MRTRSIWNTLFILTALLLIATPCLAKENGYFFVAGYSHKEKTAFISPIFTQKVDGTSYSAEEFVSDVELIQKMESQFQSYLSRSVNLESGRYTISFLGPYKSNAIASDKHKHEMGQYESKGFAVKIAQDFKFSP